MKTKLFLMLAGILSGVALASDQGVSAIFTNSELDSRIVKNLVSNGFFNGDDLKGRARKRDLSSGSVENYKKNIRSRFEPGSESAWY